MDGHRIDPGTAAAPGRFSVMRPRAAAVPLAPSPLRAPGLGALCGTSESAPISVHQGFTPRIESERASSKPSVSHGLPVRTFSALR